MWPDVTFPNFYIYSKMFFLYCTYIKSVFLRLLSWSRLGFFLASLGWLFPSRGQSCLAPSTKEVGVTSWGRGNLQCLPIKAFPCVETSWVSCHFKDLFILFELFIPTIDWNVCFRRQRILVSGSWLPPVLPFLQVGGKRRRGRIFSMREIYLPLRMQI